MQLSYIITAMLNNSEKNVSEEQIKVLDQDGNIIIKKIEKKNLKKENKPAIKEQNGENQKENPYDYLKYLKLEEAAEIDKICQIIKKRKTQYFNKFNKNYRNGQEANPQLEDLFYDIQDKKKIQQLQEKLSLSGTEIYELNNEHKKEVNKLTNKIKELHEAEEEVSTLKKEKILLEEEMDKIRAQNEMLLKQVKEFKEEDTPNQKKVKKLNKRNTDLNEKNKSLQEEIYNLNKKNSGLTDINNKLIEEVKTQRNKVNENTEKTKKIEDDYKVLTLQVIALQTKYTQLLALQKDLEQLYNMSLGNEIHYEKLQDFKIFLSSLIFNIDKLIIEVQNGQTNVLEDKLRILKFAINQTISSFNAIVSMEEEQMKLFIELSGNLEKEFSLKKESYQKYLITIAEKYAEDKKEALRQYIQITDSLKIDQISNSLLDLLNCENLSEMVNDPEFKNLELAFQDNFKIMNLKHLNVNFNQELMIEKSKLDEMKLDLNKKLGLLDSKISSVLSGQNQEESTAINNSLQQQALKNQEKIFRVKEQIDQIVYEKEEQKNVIEKNENKNQNNENNKQWNFQEYFDNIRTRIQNLKETEQDFNGIKVNSIHDINLNKNFFVVQLNKEQIENFKKEKQIMSSNSLNIIEEEQMECGETLQEINKDSQSTKCESMEELKNIGENFQQSQGNCTIININMNDLIKQKQINVSNNDSFEQK